MKTSSWELRPMDTNTTELHDESIRGAVLSSGDSWDRGIVDFLGECLEKGCFDALLIPVEVPAGDSYAWVLLHDRSMLERASPLPPLMSVHGAKVLQSLTRHGRDTRTVAALLRPCEVRGVIELQKLNQLNLENIVLISIDCPGTLPRQQYIKDPDTGATVYREVCHQWGGESVRPVCQICDEFSLTASDLHVGILGAAEGEVLLIPRSSKGEKLLEGVGMEASVDVSGWRQRVEELTEERKEKRATAFESLRPQVTGIQALQRTLSRCINCHNCMRACPICYCRQCYFDSESLQFSPEHYLARARRKGGLHLPADGFLFHVGRMAHMTLSCLSCGACEDACPMDIPVAQMFSLVAEEVQALFGYVPGRSVEEPLPLTTFKQEELEQVEELCLQSAPEQEAEDA
jgi:formate dehydrogenase subunit beta